MHRQIALMREYRTRLIADVVTGKVDVRGMMKDEGGRMKEAEEPLAQESDVVEDTAEEVEA